MADAQVQIVISAKDNASSVLKRVGGSATDLAKTLAVGLVAGAAGLAAGLGAAVNAAAGFEQKMSAVKAVSGATAAEMGQLSSLALKLGKDTSFSASEAAAGLEELVKGGVSIPEIMNGAAEATLNLAAAGGVSLPAAAEIAANALNTFNLSGEDMAHVADLIAGAANASTIGVDDFRMSIVQTGGVLASMGGTFDDAALAITAMGNAGYKGSDAGTSLKNMFLSMAAPTKEATTRMKELGIVTAEGKNQFFDATGSLKDYRDVSQVLQDALKGQTDEQKAATLETLFGRDAYRAADVAARLGADGVDLLAQKMAGISAADVARERLNNLRGDLEQLGGAAEVAAITLGLAFQAPMRAATQALTDFINNSVTPFIEQHGPAIAQAMVDAGKGLGDFAERTKRGAVQGLDDFGKKLDEIGARAAPWAAEHGAAGKAVELSLSGVHGAALALQFLLEGNFPAAAETARGALGNFGGAAEQIATVLTDTLSPAIDVARERFEALRGAMQATDAAAAERGAQTDLIQAQRDLGTATSDLDAAFRGLASAFAPARAEGEATGESFNFAAEVIKRFTERIQSMAVGAAAIAGGIRDLGDAFNSVGQKADELGGAAQRVKDQLAATGPSLRTVITLADELSQALLKSGPAIQEFADQVGASFSGLGATVRSGLTGMIAAAGTAFSQLGTIASTGAQTTVAMIGSGFSRLGTLTSTQFVAMVTAVGAAFSQLGTLASSRAQAVASSVGTGFSQLGTLTSTQFAAMVTAAGAVFSELGTLASSRAQAIATSVGDGFSQLGTIVSQRLSEMAATIGSTLGGLAASAGAQASAIGASIVSSLAGGITAGVSRVASAAANLVSSAMAAARNALPGGEPHSPWPAFEELGVNVAEGLAAGIEDATGLAEEAAAEMAEAVSEAVAEELEGIQPEVAQAGIDLGQSVADAIGAGLGKVKTIEAGVDSLKGTVAGAMRDLAGEVDKLNRETERKFSEVGRKAGDALRDAVRDADRSIRDTISDVADRISDMRADLDLSRLIRGQRDTFSAGQDAASRARSNTGSDEDVKRSRKRDTEDVQRDRAIETGDIARDRARDDAEAEIELARDLRRAKTAEDRASIQERANDAREDRARQRQAQDEDLVYRRKAEDADRAYRQQREDEDRAERRTREAEDRTFSQGQDAARQAFDDNLENEALGRSIDRANKDRDARITAINEALVEKQAKIRDDAATEQADLLAATKLKTQTLKDEFVANLPPLLAGAQEIVNNFLLGIDQAFERVAGLAGIATTATGTVGAAFGTTAEAAQTMATGMGISLEQAEKILADAGNTAQTVMATDIPFVFEVTDKAVEEFAHKFGLSWDEARKILTEGGRIADLVMGREIPKAAAETAIAVAKAGTAAVDLKVPVKDAQGALETLAKEGFDNAKSATDKAKDAATQISAVLQGLADKMPALVTGIRDFVTELSKIPKEIAVNIRTVGSVNAGAGSGGGGGGGGDDGGSGSGGSESSVDFARAESDQGYRDELRDAGYAVGEENGKFYVEERAKGGPVKRGEPYLVGEQGPEIFTPKQNGVIVPNAAKTQKSTYWGDTARKASDQIADAARLMAKADSATPRQHGGPANAGQRYLAGEVGAEMFVPKRAGTAESSAAPIDYDLLARKIAGALTQSLPGVQLSVGVDDIHSALVRKSGRNGGTLGF